ncbi:MAG: DUF393 domain-containing protein [Planctomycetes bacterium]|nr:DUF393 domain-containing protein [Planctomycetota bacterium]
MATQDRGWVLYDGECPLCCALADRFRAVLEPRGFRLSPLQAPWAMARLGLRAGAPLDEMRVLTAQGEVLGGAPAVLHLSRFVWWARPLRGIARIPGGRRLLDAAYAWAARHRFAARRFLKSGTPIHCTNGHCAGGGNNVSTNRSRPLTAETTIRTDPERVWRASQTPNDHVRWDARFTEIESLNDHVRWDARFTDIEYCERNGDAQRFRYATRLGFGVRIEGFGETVPRADRRASSLRFGSNDSKSLVRDGAGSWVYEPAPGGVHFRTAFDYDVRWGGLGRALDRLAFRPLFEWATRWSFDRLRLWIERGIEPEAARSVWLAKIAARTALGLEWLLEGILPKIVTQPTNELAIVERSHLYWPTPHATLLAIGVGEAVVGLWLLSGRAERAAAGVAAIGVVGFSTLCLTLEPSALADPFGGILKNFTLLACAAAVALLAPHAPKAARARGGRRS